MAEKDVTENTLLSQPMVFADFCNGYFFDGNSIIQIDNLKTGNTMPVYYYDTHNRLRYVVRDVVMDLYGEDGIVATIGIENQSNYDGKMIERVFHYDGSNYITQYKDSKSKENDHFVVTVVINYSDEKYTKNNFTKYFNIDKQNTNIQKLFSYSTDFKLNTLNFNDKKLDYLERFGNNDLRFFFEAVYANLHDEKDQEVFIDYIKDKKIHMYYPNETYIAIKAVTRFDLTKFLEDSNVENKEGGYIDVCDVVEAYTQRITKKVTEKVSQDTIKEAIKGFIIKGNVSNETIKQVYPSYTDEMIDEIRKEINKA